jgi:four helix bundle protein
MHKFKSFKVWQKAMELSVDIYKLIANFPSEEKYGLTSQIRRAAISIPSNIAEGSARSDKDFIRFLSISLGSAFELETQILLAIELRLISQENSSKILTEIAEIQKMLIGLQNKLQNNNLLNEDETEYLITPSNI